MSLLPNQIIPQTMPWGTANQDGTVTVAHDWWLFLYNLAEQVLSNGSGATTAELAQGAFFRASGTDYEHQIAALGMLTAALPNPAGRIATLERELADLQSLVYSKLRAG